VIKNNVMKSVEPNLKITHITYVGAPGSRELETGMVGGSGKMCYARQAEGGGALSPQRRHRAT
jgi:hypothetical protein